MAKNELSVIFGNNIHRKRKQLGLTQDELAEKLGIGQQSLSRMERGTMAPKFERLQDIADILHCPVSELFVHNANKNTDIEMIITDILNGLNPKEKHSILKFVSDASQIFKSYDDE